MNTTPDTEAADNGGSFDPQQAAALLDQTTVQARRKLEPYPPWLLALRGLGALVVYGGLWLSVRGQHPYLHPTVAAVPGAVAFGIANTIATVAVAKRATAGVVGRSQLRRADIVLWTALWVGAFVVMGALIGAGVSDRIVYGLYPAAAPLLLAGVGWASVTAARANWRQFGAAIVIAAIGVGALFAGPAGAWLVCGVGICVALLGQAAFVARRQRA
jgi:hypothetical protein